MKITFATFVGDLTLIVFVIVGVLMVGCSSNQPVNAPDMVGPDGLTPEASIVAIDEDNVSSQTDIVASVQPTRPSVETIETTIMEQEVLASLIKFDRVYQNLGIKKITDIVDPSDGDSRLYIATQDGTIYSLDSTERSSDAAVFLDLGDRVSTQYNEEGLLGIAFDPDFHITREFYVYYVAPSPRRSVIARYVDHGYGLDADESSEDILLEIPQPFGNHNGGQLLFGPDGFLYIGLGDGGGANDPDGNAQNLETLLGSILRIDVTSPDQDRLYGIPETNPFFSSSESRPEIWAYGFRNPWRFAFDVESDKLWVADVGQERWEEINKVVGGSNYGWNKVEGLECMNGVSECSVGTIAPVWTYGREQGCSVIGGVVYTGSKVPQLNGMYMFGDHCTGEIWALKERPGHLFVVHLGYIEGNITTFGSDEQGQVYIGTRNGEIYFLNANP